MIKTRATRRATPAIAIGLFAAIVWSTAASGATLKPQVFVNGDAVLLGDLFDGVGSQHDAVVTRAPAPGQSFVLDAAWLYRLARGYGLDWRPTAGFDQAVVRRTSTQISQDAVLRALHDALGHRIGKGERFEVELDNPALAIHLPAHFPPTIAVRSLYYDPASSRLSALMVAPDDRPDAVRVQVSGRTHKLVEVPITNAQLRPDSMIGAGDIRTVMLRADQVDRNALLDPDAIIGKSPRRLLDTDRVVRSADIREPILVQRNSFVTMIYRTDNMVITSKGRSRDHGTRGDTVRIVNTMSGKLIEAVVIGAGEVAVGSTPMTAPR
jgi:flagellar basal body P-ring formation protein FlgA